MSRKRKRNRGQCGYCGVNAATTTDHVIPRGIWGDNFPAQLQLPTIPACDPCNQGFSADKEYFRLHVSAGLAGEHPVVRSDTWPGPIRRMLQMNPRLREELARTAKPTTLELPSGEVINTVSVEFDRSRIGKVVEKLGRGAYYLDLNRPLPPETRIRTFTGVPEFLEVLVGQCEENNLGGIVRVRRGYDPDDPHFMLATFQFYDAGIFTVLTQGRVQSPK